MFRGFVVTLMHDNPNTENARQEVNEWDCATWSQRLLSMWKYMDFSNKNYMNLLVQFNSWCEQWQVAE